MEKKRELSNDREIETRDAASRLAQEREHQKRRIVSMYHRNPFDFFPEEIPEGYTYLWVRESLLGQPDNANMARKRSQGWTPVPASRHPERATKDFFGRLGHEDYLLEGGLILCERPTELSDLENKISREYNYKIMHSMPGTENFMSEPTIPVKNFSNMQFKYTNA